MAQNIEITIPNPVLLTNQHFKVRFKPHNTPTWTTLPNQTNATFAINNLSDGDYDIEYSLVLEDGTECPAFVEHFNIHTAGCPCVTNVVGEVEEVSANNFQIKITFTNPTSQPACGWIVDYTNSSNFTTIANYPTLTSPLIIPIPINDAFIVRITADCCSRDQVECIVMDLGRAQGSKCTPGVFPRLENQNLLYQVGGQYYLQVTCTQQSNPVTNSFTIHYQQDQLNTTSLLDTGTRTVIPTGTAPNILLTFPVYPSPTQGMSYQVQVQDICGQFQSVYKL